MRSRKIDAWKINARRCELLAPLGWTILPGISVFESDEHWTSHSVPGIRSQQMAVQSPSTAETTVRWCKGAFVIDVAGISVEKSASHDQPQSKSLSASLMEQVSWQAPLEAETTVRRFRAVLVFGITVDMTVDVVVDVDVDVAVEEIPVQ